MMSFEAKDTRAPNWDQEIFDCGSSLDGSVLPGDKLKGDVCWSGAAADVIKILLQSDLFGSGAVVWEVKRDRRHKRRSDKVAYSTAQQVDRME